MCWWCKDGVEAEQGNTAARGKATKKGIEMGRDKEMVGGEEKENHVYKQCKGEPVMLFITIVGTCGEASSQKEK